MLFRPESEIWPLMSEDELRALAVDIEKRGQINPILTFEGDILDGRNRWLAITKYCENGTKPKFEVAKTDSPIAFVVSLNEKRRHLSESQRSVAGARALPFYEAEAKKRQEAGQERGRATQSGSGPNGPQPNSKPIRARDEAAADFGTTGRSVERAKRVLKTGSAKVIKAVEEGRLSVAKAEQIAKEAADKKEQDRLLDASIKSKNATRVGGLTGEIEWYTPTKYLEAARFVMGGIDLDPASSAFAQQHVKASKWFTVEDNGLTQEWIGRVFLNPPYEAKAVRAFVEKLLESVRIGDVSQAVLLTNNSTDTEWWHLALGGCSSICFTRGRISFIKAIDGRPMEHKGNTNGQTFFYFGHETDEFAKVFSSFGSICVTAIGEPPRR